MIDLDALSRRLVVPLEVWRQRAVVHPLTWRDEGASWPKPIVEERDRVEVPESLGVHLDVLNGENLGVPAGEMHVTVWAGGWADVQGIVGAEEIVEGPQFGGIDAAYESVVSVVERFLLRVEGAAQ